MTPAAARATRTCFSQDTLYLGKKKKAVAFKEPEGTAGVLLNKANLDFDQLKQAIEEATANGAT